MVNKILQSLLISSIALFSSYAYTGPKQDLEAFQSYFKKRFPDTSLVELSNGLYAFDEMRREQWVDMMDFPAYEIDLDKGKKYFNTPFKNGKTYADCMENKGQAIAHTYPRFNNKNGKVETLSSAINACRISNNEQAYPSSSSELTAILTYLAHTSRGQKTNISIPNDKRALAAYEDGKRSYFSRRGPYGFACYHCHWETASIRIRGNVLSTAVGQTTHFPTYRTKTGDIHTLQRRYKSCMKNTGAKPYPSQSEKMNNLEYFHRYINNGIPVNAPGMRF